MVFINISFSLSLSFDVDSDWLIRLTKYGSDNLLIKYCWLAEVVRDDGVDTVESSYLRQVSGN